MPVRRVSDGRHAEVGEGVSGVLQQHDLRRDGRQRGVRDGGVGVDLLQEGLRGWREEGDRGLLAVVRWARHGYEYEKTGGGLERGVVVGYK